MKQRNVDWTKCPGNEAGTSGNRSLLLRLSKRVSRCHPAEIGLSSGAGRCDGEAKGADGRLFSPGWGKDVIQKGLLQMDPC